MNARIETQRVHVPRHRDAPPYAAQIGSLAATVLGRLVVTGAQLLKGLAALAPTAIRAELARSAKSTESTSPALAAQLHSASREAWSH